MTPSEDGWEEVASMQLSLHVGEKSSSTHLGMPALPANCPPPRPTRAASSPETTQRTRVMPSSRAHQQPRASHASAFWGSLTAPVVCCAAASARLLSPQQHHQLRHAVPVAVALSTRPASWPPALACFQVRWHASPCPHCAIEALPTSSPCLSPWVPATHSFPPLAFPSQLSVWTADSCHVCPARQPGPARHNGNTATSMEMRHCAVSDHRQTFAFRAEIPAGRSCADPAPPPAVSYWPVWAPYPWQ